MNWLVTIDKENNLFVMTRQERNTQVDIFIFEGNGVPSRVLKTFDTEAEANKYVENIKNGEYILWNVGL